MMELIGIGVLYICAGVISIFVLAGFSAILGGAIWAIIEAVDYCIHVTGPQLAGDICKVSALCCFLAVIGWLVTSLLFGSPA